MNGGCLCGRVTILVANRPEYLNECNCTLCLKAGAMWGYFPAGDVTIDGATACYVRADVDDPYLRIHFCARCGATTHWSFLKPDAPARAGVNMRLFDPAALRGIELRFGDRRNSDSIPRSYYRAPVAFDGLGAKA